MDHPQLAWYIGGPILGLCVVAMRWLLNERLGATGAWSEIVERLSDRTPALGTRGFFFAGLVLGGLVYALAAGGPTFHGYGWLTDTFHGTGGTVVLRGRATSVPGVRGLEHRSLTGRQVGPAFAVVEARAPRERTRVVFEEERPPLPGASPRERPVGHRLREDDRGAGRARDGADETVSGSDPRSRGRAGSPFRGIRRGTPGSARGR